MDSVSYDVHPEAVTEPVTGSVEPRITKPQVEPRNHPKSLDGSGSGGAEAARIHLFERIVPAAALYVLPDGPYASLPGVELWDTARDARLYPGPWPVVAHPPCERWGRYWHGGPNSVRFPRVRKVRGDDGGRFAAALAAVRRWGGVLEHPADSSAWRAFGLRTPPRDGGWVSAGLWDPGWTCCVEQGHYGHRARKATWLYAAHVDLPLLRWGPSARRVRLDAGYHSAEERRQAVKPPSGLSCEERAKRREWLETYSRETGKVWACPERMGKRERLATPEPFRDLLLAIARTAAPLCQLAQCGEP